MMGFRFIHTTRFCLIPLPDNFVNIQTDRFFIYRKVEDVHHFTKLNLLLTDNVDQKIF